MKRNHVSKTLAALKHAVTEAADEEYKIVNQCVLVVLAAEEVGADIERLVEFTRYPRTFIEDIDRRMRAARLWISKVVDDREWRDGSAEFLRVIFKHALVASGQLLREPTTDGGFRYVDPETGEINGRWRPVGSWSVN